MREESALRYLLTRQIWALRNAVAEKCFEEVSGSLSVERKGREYVLRWTREGQSFEEIIPGGDYTFYRKGDQEGSTGVEGRFERENVDKARAFALRALDLEGRMELFRPPKVGVRAQERLALVWHVALCLTLSVSALPGSMRFAPVLLAVLLLEYVPRWGRLLASLGLLVLALSGVPFTMVLAGIGYGLAQFLDPNPAQRKLRAILCLTLVVLGIVQVDLTQVGVMRLGLGLLLLGVVSPVVLFRWTLGIHSRAFHLVMPGLAVGLVLDGAFAAGAILAINGILCLAARMYCWRWFAHPNASTFQGVSIATRQ